MNDKSYTYYVTSITIRQVECICPHSLESQERRDQMCYQAPSAQTASTTLQHATDETTYTVKSFTVKSSLVTTEHFGSSQYMK